MVCDEIWIKFKYYSSPESIYLEAAGLSSWYALMVGHADVGFVSWL